VAVRAAVQAPRVDELPAPRHPRWAGAAVLACYVLAAFGLTWRLWAAPAAQVPTTNGHGVSADIYLSAWFMRYAATSLTHGHLPALATTALNYPQGVSVMWNTSILLPGVVLAPITLLAGPLVSLTVLITAGFAGSAATMFFVLRRWGGGLIPAAIGGALFGFSPALRLAAQDHYHLQFAVLIPLIIDAALRLVTGRAAPVRTGLWLGLMMAAQIFIAEELLVDAAIGVLIMTLVLLAGRPRPGWARIRSAAAGLAISALVVGALCGYALWSQFRGPLAEVGSPWNLSIYGNQPADFVVAPPAVVLHTHGAASFAQFLASTNERLVEYFSYLGWPLLIAVLAATIWWWRDVRIRVTGVSFIVLELFSIGGHDASVAGSHLPPYLLPWHWLERLPVLSQVLPNRFSILADGAAAAVLAFALQRAWTARPSVRWHRAVVAGATVAVLLPLLPLPLSAEHARPTPPGWRTVLADLRLRPGATVLELPILGPRTMLWQARANADISLAGGYCITRAHNGRAASCDTRFTLTADQQTMLLRLHWVALARPGYAPPSPTTTLRALADWKPAAVVTTVGAQSPLGQYLVEVLGPPTVQHGRVLGWRLPWLPLLHQLEDGDVLLAGRAECDRQPAADRELVRLGVHKLGPPPGTFVELGNRQHSCRGLLVTYWPRPGDRPTYERGAAASWRPLQVQTPAGRALDG